MASLDKFKVSAAQWDSDKEPTRFVDFMFIMTALVRSLDQGNTLEDWIDRKLGRSRHQHVTTPSFVASDPEFQREAAQHQYGCFLYTLARDGKATIVADGLNFDSPCPGL